MAVMGIWHGASWNFLIWGLVHGVFLASYTVLRKQFPNASSNKFFKSRIGKISSILITQYLVFFTFIAFWMKDFDHMFYSMKKYIFLDFDTTQTIEIIQANEFPILLLVLFAILHFISYKGGNMVERISTLKIRYWMIFLITIFTLISLFYSGTPQEFIYFEF
tara:strand:- start:144 stop:632 length:489 start_codon:yes stop_codon:yes gene_type:complete